MKNCTIYYGGDLPPMLACADFPGKVLGVSKQISQENFEYAQSLAKSLQEIPSIPGRFSFEIEITDIDYEHILGK